MNDHTIKYIVAGGFVVAAFAGGGMFFLVRSGYLTWGEPSGYDALMPSGRTWRSVRGKHWQIVSTRYEEANVTDAREKTRGDCPAGMVHVRGNMKQEPDNNPYSSKRIDKLQISTCVDWIQKRYPERCQRFDRAKWEAIAEGLPTRAMSFCIDRFEYPNRRGQYPLIYANFHESKKLCAKQGKRLCNEDEWTFACEGEQAKPYPYGNGYVRDPKKCVTDRTWMPYNEQSMVPRNGKAAGKEMDRLWKGHASGAQGACRSEFGVYDMTGNIDEWTVSARKHERPSILKGGYWGPVRTRCRPTTRSHDENHMFYQQGFRCCANANQGKSAPVPPAAAGPIDGPLK